MFVSAATVMRVRPSSLLLKGWQQLATKPDRALAMASSSSSSPAPAPPPPPSSSSRNTTTKEEHPTWRRASSKGDKKGYSKEQSRGYMAEKKSPTKQDRIYYLGRLLTNILRHRAVDLNLKIRADGYIAVADLLKLGVKTMAGIPLSVYTVEDVMKAVEQDNKQRFGLLEEDGILLIRANQGHSLKAVETEKLLKPILSADEIPVCIHGTSMKNLDSILSSGLKRMGRNHVHFATGLPREDGVISGMRSSSDVIIYLDSKKALEDSMKLYMSDNGVVLTEGFDGVVLPKYFAHVAKWRKGKAVPLDLTVKKD